MSKEGFEIPNEGEQMNQMVDDFKKRSEGFKEIANDMKTEAEQQEKALPDQLRNLGEAMTAGTQDIIDEFRRTRKQPDEANKRDKKDIPAKKWKFWRERP